MAGVDRLQGRDGEGDADRCSSRSASSSCIVPEANQGDIMGDLNAKRGRIQGSAAIGGGEVEIVALVPTSEVLRYVIDLRSMTGGRGRFTMQHSHYDPVPAAPRRQARRAGRAGQGLSDPVRAHCVVPPSVPAVRGRRASRQRSARHATLRARPAAIVEPSMAVVGTAGSRYGARLADPAHSGVATRERALAREMLLVVRDQCAALG